MAGRTQSASVRPAGEERSASQQRPASALGSSSDCLYRSPSYRLLGGRLMDTMLTTSHTWRDEASGAGGDQTLNITRSSSTLLIRVVYLYLFTESRT